jgi:hypothetical protein
MDKAQIEKIMRDVAGDPSSGVVHDMIPGFAAAIDAALNGVKPAEQRVVKSPETR